MGSSSFEILCPKCPLTPIISFTLNKEGILTCEYRCPYIHFGQVYFENIIKDKENKHGTHCDRCIKNNKLEKNKIKGELLYCGTCRHFICSKCRNDHDKEKETHKILIPKSKLNYTCLEHGVKYIGYCFTCLISICPNCKRHEKHCIKKFEEFYPDNKFINDYNYYIKDYDLYINSFKNSYKDNPYFIEFKKRSDSLINISKYLFNNFNSKKKSNTLNGELLINLLNVVYFNFKSNNIKKEQEYINYFKTHMILYNRPISDICTFSKTKSDYKVGNLKLKEYTILNFDTNNNINFITYSSISNCILFLTNSIIYFLNISNSKEKNNKLIKLGQKSNINSFNIINKKILCVCSDQIYLYELKNMEPYYEEYKQLPVLNLFSDNVKRVLGNFDKNLIVMTSKEICIVNKELKNDNYHIVKKINFLENNKNININKYSYNNDYEINYSNFYTCNYDLEIDYKEDDLKGIYNDYIITIEKKMIISRKINDLEKIGALNSRKDCLVYNGNVLISDYSKINFYSIPNLQKVSTVYTSEYILYMCIPNKKSFIIIEDNLIEQLEINTWKRISILKDSDFGLKINNKKNLYVIGLGKELFFYNKENKILYSTK